MADIDILHEVWNKFVTSWYWPNYYSEIYYKNDSENSLDYNKKETATLSNKNSLYLKITPKSKYKLNINNLEKTGQDGWEKLPESKFLFYAIVTHEVRSSMNEEVFAPFARINDGKMFIVGVKN